MTAPAGWYPDPVTGSGQRYFDGTDWTGHYTPPAPVAPYMQPQYIAVSQGSDHTFHLLMTLLTCGLWIPIWVIMEIVSAARKR